MRQIRLGQRYRKTGAVWTVWRVVGGGQESGGLRHYRIADESDPSTTKLISEKTLADPKLYELIAEPQ